MDGRTLTTIAEDLLKACVDAYSQVPNAPQPPARHYLAHGPAPATGDQLTVAVTNVKVSNQFPTQQVGPIQLSAVGAAELTIECYRAGWPTVDTGVGRASLPDPEALTHAAMALQQDAITIWLWIAALAARGTLFPSVEGVIGVGDTALGPMLPVPVSGQVAGWRMPVTAKLAIP